MSGLAGLPAGAGDVPDVAGEATWKGVGVGGDPAQGRQDDARGGLNGGMPSTRYGDDPLAGRWQTDAAETRTQTGAGMGVGENFPEFPAIFLDGFFSDVPPAADPA